MRWPGSRTGTPRRSRGTLPCLLIAAAGWSLPVLAALPRDAMATDQDDIDRIIAAALADTNAYHLLEQLCDVVGCRLAGSPQMQTAVAWAVGAMQTAGFDSVWTEPVDVPRWVRGREEARVTAPQPWPLHMLGLGRSVGTPPEGIEAPVIAVTSFEELDARAADAAGKIVLFDEPWEGYGRTVRYRMRGASAAAHCGARACLIRSVTDLSLGTPHTGVMSYVDSLPRIPVAALTVEDAGRLHRLCQQGLQPRVHLFMEAHSLPDVESHNVVGEIRGRQLPEEIVLLGAHLDSWDVGTGAHDNGAGCIIAMQAARELLAAGLRPRRTVRVVLFEAEEFGGLGGRAYAAAHRAEIGRHVAALESDSGAFPPAGFSVKADSLVVGRLREMVAPLSACRELAAIRADSVRAGGAGTDIDPVVDLGVPGIGLDTHASAYFHYHHSPADTFDKIDPVALAQNVAAMAALLYALAEEPVPLRPQGKP